MHLALLRCSRISRHMTLATTVERSLRLASGWSSIAAVHREIVRASQSQLSLLAGDG